MPARVKCKVFDVLLPCLHSVLAHFMFGWLQAWHAAKKTKTKKKHNFHTCSVQRHTQTGIHAAHLEVANELPEALHDIALDAVALEHRLEVTHAGAGLKACDNVLGYRLVVHLKVLLQLCTTVCLL